MLHTTRAVALRIIRQSDRFLVLQAYTETFGRRACLVRNGRGRAAARPQPLDRLELVMGEAHGDGLAVVRDWRVERPYLQVRSDHARGLLLLFAQEVLHRALREESPDPDLFRFVQEVLEELDQGDDLAHFPLHFLVRLMDQLGFLPEPHTEGRPYFDLQEGRFIAFTETHRLCMDLGDSTAFKQLLDCMPGGVRPQLAADRRRSLLRQLLLYLRLHVEGFGQLNSPEVIHAVLG